MLTKNDCLLLLGELQENGVDVKIPTSNLIKSTSIQTDVLKFINRYKPFDLLNFYDRLRVNYNKKKSKLYKEIVQIDEKEPKDILITMSSLLTQILLYSNTVTDKAQFLKHSRATEISKVMTNYFTTYDLTLCVKLLNLIKADLKALESIKESK